MAKILPMRKKPQKSSEAIKIQALADRIVDLEGQVYKLSGLVSKLLKFIEKKR